MEWGGERAGRPRELVNGRPSLAEGRRPEAMSGSRRAAVAGTFYADTAAGLRGQVEECLPGEPDSVARQPAIAAVCPHAGLRDSGKTAGAVYGRMAPPDTLVILGPNHHGVGAAAALASHARWETPLGPVAIDG